MNKIIKLRLVFYLAIFFLLPGFALAGEWVNDDVTYEDGIYKLNIKVLLDSPYKEVHKLLTDYNNLTKLNPTMKESNIISNKPGNLIIKTVTEDCVVLFCSKIINTQSVTEPEPGHIISKTLPEQSNLKSGNIEWFIKPQGQKTMVSMLASFKPDFWIPPIFGPAIVKSRIKSASENSMLEIENISKN